MKIHDKVQKFQQRYFNLLQRKELSKVIYNENDKQMISTSYYQQYIFTIRALEVTIKEAESKLCQTDD